MSCCQMSGLNKNAFVRYQLREVLNFSHWFLTLSSIDSVPSI